MEGRFSWVLGVEIDLKLGREGEFELEWVVSSELLLNEEVEWYLKELELEEEYLWLLEVDQ